VGGGAVGFGGFLEFGFGSGVVGMVVRMVLPREAAVCTLDVRLSGVLAQTENFVIISL